ncbi:MAG: AAA family ATPase [Gemmatimonadales bacterium]
MLTRIRVRGFKNLRDVEVRFGAFTCIAGTNAVGKSNLFDAILFLGSLASKPCLEAALSVRDKTGRFSDLESLFSFDNHDSKRQVSLEADLLLPRSAVDDLGQTAIPKIYFVTYSVTLELVESTSDVLQPSLRIVEESLHYIQTTSASKRLGRWQTKAWLRSVVSGRRTSPFISTKRGSGKSTIRLHQDGRSGRNRDFRGDTLPRTVLSTVNAIESPTALVARREMQSWSLLALEPSALRSPDTYSSPSKLGADGSHLPATLYALQRSAEAQEHPALRRDYSGMVGARLAELVEDVAGIAVERDDRRELLTLFVQDTVGGRHPARALSDGTLRFIALSVLEADPRAGGVLCFEEPENGIHPARIPAMIRLLRDLAVDPRQPVDRDNPLRQVIVNTHSPAVIGQVPSDSLLFAERVNAVVDGVRVQNVVFRPVEGSWRSEMDGAPEPVQKGAIISYLNPTRQLPTNVGSSFERLVDRPDIAQLLFWPPTTTEERAE